MDVNNWMEAIENNTEYLYERKGKGKIIIVKTKEKKEKKTENKKKTSKDNYKESKKETMWMGRTGIVERTM